ncbi:uncharacterized protein VDAG_08847 [Verticillium dahliae VdLs.17]|uniref:Uncharacterized protein n=1 Tax=Verticillium dahliae (strain VdLs.17 / ATCC MYA-4575 / FGSC 10137) TaxID=498257 RepID=G2XFB5_VERDV|nr:uncharacterized protein VDAG_08847 [Verticillium dahliae VdLs.17]EGY18513.1 hypothetical protein VDAG_08847 [Verticillium dahliae VdLs.17]KAH6688207.1 hypothetical protein EV126DRAFT_126289 [Verticillium dahliae]
MTISDDPDGKASRKGKEHDTEDVLLALDSEVKTSPSPSLVSRLQASATALSRTVISGQPESAVLGTTSSDKQQQSSGGTSTSAAATATSLSLPLSRQGNTSSNKSSSPGHSHVSESQYNNFINSPTTATSSSIGPGSSSTHQLVNQVRPAFSGFTGGPSEWEVQASRDGIEAVQLLSDPETQDIITRDSLESTPVLSPHEIATLRLALFGENQSQTVERTGQGWDELLNFQPDFLIAGDRDASYQHLGIRDPQRATRTWLADWRHVLSSYTDEVWGDLGPLAEAARNELNDTGDQISDSPPTDMRALGRLRQILAHVRDSH